MILALITLILTFVILIIITKQKNIKILMFVLLAITTILTVGLCIKQPAMHNRISLNIIDYLIKFNTDGSMTTTKQVTTEVIKENGK